jgi:hypothetical protein
MTFASPLITSDAALPTTTGDGLDGLFIVFELSETQSMQDVS